MTKAQGGAIKLVNRDNSNMQKYQQKTTTRQQSRAVGYRQQNISAAPSFRWGSRINRTAELFSMC